MPRHAQNCLLTLLISMLVACKPAIDLTSDITKGWDGHAWGTDQQQIIDELGLSDADATTTPSGVTFVKTTRVRKLGDASVSVQLAFVNNKLAGLSFTSLPASDPNDAATALDKWFGSPGVDNVWTNKSVTAQLSSKDDLFVVTILDQQQLMTGLSGQLDETKKKLDELKGLIEESKPSESAGE